MKSSKPYQKMTARELAAATKQFDREFIADKSRSLSPEEEKQWRRAKRKRGRPTVGLGHCRVSVSMEQSLLKRVTALAKKRGVSRSKLFADVMIEALAQQNAR
jgi:Ribbon-helix-helix protein, copG family